jgi:hypothetical protein
MAQIGNLVSVMSVHMDETPIVCYHTCELLLLWKYLILRKPSSQLHHHTIEDIKIDVIGTEFCTSKHPPCCHREKAQTSKHLHGPRKKSQGISRFPSHHTEQVK